MRIISGSLRGRVIRSPQGDTRPAMARTREALFSMLEARGMTWSGAKILDLFAGSGSLAFEALSRGAAYAILVDNSEELRKTLAANMEELGLQSQCRLIKEDVLRFLRKPAPMPFNLVFDDPPYRRNYTSRSLELLAKGDWLVSGGFIAAEIEKDLVIEAPASFEAVGERLFGQTMVRLWQKI